MSSKRKRAPATTLAPEPTQSIASKASKRSKQRSTSAHNSNGTSRAKDVSSTYCPTQCQAWFERYQESDSDAIGPEGIDKLCGDIGISSDNLGILLLFYKLQAKTMGYVTKAEWQAGMKALNVDSAEKLVKAVARLEDDMKDMAVFRDFYIWLFTFAKDSEQRNLEIDAAKALWLLALPSSRYPTVSKFLAFLDEARPLKVINKDQWRSLLDFLVMVPGDFSNYDDSNAWPTLFDQFVAWARKSAP